MLNALKVQRMPREQRRFLSAGLVTKLVGGRADDSLYRNLLTMLYQGTRPSVDFCLSLFGLIICLPLFIVIGIINKATSRGPVFYTQERVGRNGRTFKIIKFRSMCVDSESQSGAVWAKKNDSRVTPFGRFLRKTHLDELPQLINVIKGDMSVIGPRPERPMFVEKI
ncbi:MAG: sugar transferase [Candidatus Anammoxibacter sp.]